MVQLLSRDRFGEVGTVVRVADDRGVERVLTFDHDPTDAEVISALTVNAPRDLIGATKGTIEPGLVTRYETWQRWRASHAEAVARAMAAPTVTALAARTEAAWAAYAAAIGEWRQAVP